MANYILLERIELNANTREVAFTNIPQTGYTDLKIVISARNTNANYGGFYMRLNSSSTGITGRRIKGENGSASSDTSIEIPWNQSSWTASTFGNAEIYIPNYAGSTNKSASIDAVAENNGTDNRMTLNAWLWSNTAAITSISFGTFDLGFADSFTQYSTFSLYGLAALGTTPVIAPKASGGNIQTDGTYWYHTFLATGAFVPQVGLTCDALVIAGGGSGGSSSGGGGGAGGVVYATNRALTTTSYTVTVGGGAANAVNDGSNGTQGSNSTLDSMTAIGGGYGSRYGGTDVGGSGGSGGGGGQGLAGGSSTQTSGTGFTGYGSAGGTGGGSAGSGGGGAGAAGTTSSGGAGLNTWSSWASATSTGVSGYYAGGGGGGSYPSGNIPGGAGGGGTGGSYASGGVGGTAGTINTGSGGGGTANAQVGQAGGSGIVIIRYTIA